MRNIPVRTERLRFIVAGDPEPKIANSETGEVKTDVEGRTLYAVPLLPIPNDDRGSSIQVSVASSEPPSLAEGERVEVSGLTAFPWEINGRHGIAFRAESIRSKDPTASSVGA